jgi:hypothetical protein
VNLQSNTTNTTNGLILANLNVVKNNFDTKYNYLECNTLETNGVDILIPKIENSNLIISLYDMSENLIALNNDFQIVLYFDT